MLALKHVDLIIDTVQLLLLIEGKLIAPIHYMNIILQLLFLFLLFNDLDLKSAKRAISLAKLSCGGVSAIAISGQGRLGSTLVDLIEFSSDCVLKALDTCEEAHVNGKEPLNV